MHFRRRPIDEHFQVFYHWHCFIGRRRKCIFVSDEESWAAYLFCGEDTHDVYPSSQSRPPSPPNQQYPSAPYAITTSRSSEI